jgi:hypothetical protein
MLIKFTGEDLFPKPGESVRFINLVSVHAENPCGRTRKVLDEGMGFSRMSDGSMVLPESPWVTRIRVTREAACAGPARGWGVCSGAG